MDTAQAPLEAVRAWGQIAAAIALVARGHYPEVIIANVPGAVRLVVALRPDADRCGVDLEVAEGAAEAACGVVVRRH